MHPRTRLLPALLLVAAAGCGGGNDGAAELYQQVKVLEAKVERMSASLEACRASMREFESSMGEAGFHVNQVPDLARDVEAMKVKVAEASKILQGVTSRDGYLMVSGVMVPDEKGKPRCLLTDTGLAIFDSQGRRVGQLAYDEAARAMTATLNGHGTKSVALYAGDDRVAIGAYDSRTDRPVGWAATVTSAGEVSVGRATGDSGRTSPTTTKRTRPVTK